jgi:hypothetical protein
VHDSVSTTDVVAFTDDASQGDHDGCRDSWSLDDGCGDGRPAAGDAAGCRDDGSAYRDDGSQGRCDDDVDCCDEQLLHTSFVLVHLFAFLPCFFLY